MMEHKLLADYKGETLTLDLSKFMLGKNNYLGAMEIAHSKVLELKDTHNIDCLLVENIRIIDSKNRILHQIDSFRDLYKINEHNRQYLAK